MPSAGGDKNGGAERSGVCTWYLRHVDVFRSMTAHEADDLAHAMSVRRLRAGHLIVGPDPRPEWVYLLRDGRVRLFQRRARGEITVDQLESGHLFGVTALFGAGTELLARAETDVELCAVEGGRFLQVASHWPATLLEVAVRLGFRLPSGTEQLERMSPTGTRARLAGVLHALARDATETQPGGGLRLRGVPRHAELARQIGASRETVTRMLARLEEDGYIRRFGRQIVVPDRRRLAEDFDLRD
ncbi:MAG: Crp/Fnr family transcriptional regulator [Chloroflexi bacterium]|nr:Crp/Fnr family transcriptional regulator [Chloroflexota bacterium]MBV9545351.1 Crp/Fnr family transcriptional regulator [Chloroflexota bacterium]